MELFHFYTEYSLGLRKKIENYKTIRCCVYVLVFSIYFENYEKKKRKTTFIVHRLDLKCYKQKAL